MEDTLYFIADLEVDVKITESRNNDWRDDDNLPTGYYDTVEHMEYLDNPFRLIVHQGDDSVTIELTDDQMEKIKKLIEI